MKRFLLILLALLSALVLTGCATRRQLQVVDRITHDTLYQSNVHYDSIYVSHDRTTDYHLNPLNPLKPSETDTVFIKDRTVEYRYRLLRDTVYRVKIDSIPVIREVEVVKVERYVPVIYRLSLSIVIILTLSLIIYIVWKIRI